MNEEFFDLRRGNLSSESFWPSFTDIMMVIVIIFLMTTVLLMTKNWELLDQLRSSIAAEEQAEKVIEDTSRENTTLEQQLAFAQDEISMLRMKMMLASEQNNQLETELESNKEQAVTALAENAQLKNTLTSKEENIEKLQLQLAEVTDKLTVSNIDLEIAQKEREDDRQKLFLMTQQSDNQVNTLTSLEDKFSSLKIKYDKLIRPARTAKGKHIVSVDYERINGKERIRFKAPGDKNYTLVSRKQLHARLARLKKAHPETLYVRIIIPEQSGLSYNEAWNFMRGLLQKYDYYHRD